MIDPELSRPRLQAQLDAIVRAAMDAVAAGVAHATPALHHHTFYGASAIHPRHLVTWYVFANDVDLAQARSSGLTARLNQLTREALVRGGYPAEAVPEIFVSFASDETVRRETGGNYYQYFK